jgi:hypothetical protein
MEADEPPNIETMQEYIEILDLFMYEVRIHPQQLVSKVFEHRKAMQNLHCGDGDSDTWSTAASEHECPQEFHDRC